MARRTVRRESSVGLIVTLIFFILTSVGLGAATYFGFTQQDQLTKDKKAADDLRKDAELQRDWYQFQALQYRAWMGQTAGFDQPLDPKGDATLTWDAQLKSFRGHLDDGTLGKDGRGVDLPDKTIVTDLIKKVESDTYLVLLGKDDKGKTIPLLDAANKPIPPQNPPVLVSMTWDKEKKRPKFSYEDIYWGLRSLVYDKTQEAAAAAAAKETALAEKAAKEAELKVAKDGFSKDLKDLTDKYQTKEDNAFKDLNKKITEDLTKANDTATTRLTEKEDAVKAEKAKVTALQDRVKELEGRLTDLNDRLALQTQKTVETPSEGKPIPTDWKIVRMDKSGKQPFINLGSAANVRPGLTFSIHGAGPDGRPLPASKGTLEVLNVVSENLSQAQVVSVKDSFKDPILPGDYLYNPIFRPGGEQHVVIAGRIDMHGTKGDDLEEFKRFLNRQNVKVDAYVDPQEGTIKDGRLTVGTDYLVLGDVADVKEGPLADSIKKLQEQARNNGVRIVSAREFLESMGYRAP